MAVARYAPERVCSDNRTRHGCHTSRELDQGPGESSLARSPIVDHGATVVPIVRECSSSDCRTLTMGKLCLQCERERKEQTSKQGARRV
jgi:hypothetical protein